MSAPAAAVSGLGEMRARLAAAPGRAAAMLAATAVMSLLGLAVSLFVMQVLNRFVTHGVSGTLLTLTVGAALAVAAEHVLRDIRWRLAEDIAGVRERRLTTGLFGLILTTRQSEQAAWPPAARLELLRGAEQAGRALGPAGLTLAADLPFSLLVLAALSLLSPVLAAVTAFFCLALSLAAWLGQRRLREPATALTRATGEAAALAAAAAHAGETVRCFRARDMLMTRRAALDGRVADLTRRLGRLQLSAGSLAQTMQAALGVAVVATGAVLVVRGQLDIGTLVGANMIAGRALAPFGRIVQYGAALRTAADGLTAARRFAAEAATEPEGGRTLPDWRGGFRLSDLAAGYPGRAAPVFSGLDLDVAPGSVTAVTGRNGAGKSTLLKLAAGLELPVQGAAQGVVLIDGADLRQVSLDWWRGRISYLPQEPAFLPGTLGDNLRLARPAATDADLVRCLEAADLGDFLNRHPRHLDMEIEEGGRLLSPGIRRRLGLARALVADGLLYLLDEPTEGLDREGAQVVYRLLIDLARRGRTLVIATHDPLIIAGASQVVVLNGAACAVRRPAAAAATVGEGAP